MLLFACLACTQPETKEPVPEDTAPVGTDADEDGWTVEEGDCDDSDVWTNPGAGDVPYDGKDQDCDGADLTDNDGDGYVGTGGGGDDCNDNNDDAHPGATEVCYNYVDEDCNGDPDDDYDCDNDGFVLAQDCNDEDATVNPDATDEWYDGLDSNCDGADDFDQDGDGEISDQYEGPDCDDLDARRTSEGTETWDGVDEDCTDVVDDLRSWDLPSEWHGDATRFEAAFGAAVVAVEDTDGDGFRDVLISAPGTYESEEETVFGRVYLLPWSDGYQRPETAALATVEGTSEEELGTAMLVFENGSIALSGPGASATYLFDALSSGDVLTTDDARRTLSTDHGGGFLAAWDDGLLVGTSYESGNGTAVYHFASYGRGTATEDDALWSYEDAGDTLALANVGDVDGDGLDEVAIGLTGFSDVPGAELVTGADIDGDVTDGFLELTGFSGTPLFGGGDLDGDGLAEILVSDPEAADGAGMVYVLGDLSEGSLDELATATVTGELADGLMRASPRPADLDHDDADDVLLCAPGDGDSSVDALCAFVGGATLAAGGALVPSIEGFSITADDTDDLMGSVTLFDDTDGDGDEDLWLASPGGEGAVRYLRSD